MPMDEWEEEWSLRLGSGLRKLCAQSALLVASEAHPQRCCLYPGICTVQREVEVGKSGHATERGSERE